MEAEAGVHCSLVLDIPLRGRRSHKTVFSRGGTRSGLTFNDPVETLASSIPEFLNHEGLHDLRDILILHGLGSHLCNPGPSA